MGCDNRPVSRTGCVIVILFWPFLLLCAIVATFYDWCKLQLGYPPPSYATPPTKAQIQDVFEQYRQAKALIDSRLKELRDGKRTEQSDRGVSETTSETGTAEKTG